MRRLTYLQGLRGLAALIVLAHHFAANFYPAAVFGMAAPGHGSWEKLLWQTPLGLLVAAHSAVCLFFVLSGYVLSLPYFGAAAAGPDRLLAAMVKRPPRLLALVAAAMLLSYLLSRTHAYFNQPAAVLTGSSQLAAYFHSFPPAVLFFKNLLIDPFGFAARYDAPLWTIAYELLGSYVTFVFLLLFRGSPNRGWLYLVVGVGFLHYYVFGFIVGIALADLCDNFSSLVERCSRIWWSLPLLVAGSYFAAYPFWVPFGDVKFSWYACLPRFMPDLYPWLGASLLFAGVLLNHPVQRILATRIFSFFGRISYALYTIHFLVIFSFSSWIFLQLRQSCSYNFSAALMALASLPVVILPAYFLTVYVDEVAIRGSSRLAKRWLRQRPVAAARATPAVIAPDTSDGETP